MLLALDTATRSSGIALFDGQTLVAELNWYSGRGQTVELTPRLVQLLAWHRLKAQSIRAVTVAIGPGSYTGLRVALTLAKGMAMAQDLPIIGIPTLDATVYPFLSGGLPVAAVVQAGRGQLCWAVYGAQPLGDLPMSPVTLGPWLGWRTAYRSSGQAELAEVLRNPIRLVGELPTPLGDALRSALGAQAQALPLIAGRRRAAALAELGWLRLQAGEIDDPASLSPLYLREP